MICAQAKSNGTDFPPVAMGFWLSELASALFLYVASTYTAPCFVLGAELSLIGLHFADQTVFADLPPLVLRWHTLFLLPLILFPTLHTFLHKLAPETGSANTFLAIIAMVCWGSFSYAPVVSVLIFVVAVSTAFSQQSATILRVMGSTLFGTAAYLLSSFFPVAFVPTAYVLCVGGVGLAVWSGIDAKPVGGKNFHAGLVRNLGFLAFDLMYRIFGATDFGVFGGLAAAFLLQYAGFLMQEVNAHIPGSKKVE